MGSHPILGLAELLVASCYRNRNVIRQLVRIENRPQGLLALRWILRDTRDKWSGNQSKVRTATKILKINC